MKGIGTDIEDIARFRKLNPQEHQNFLHKIYTQKELDYCFSKEYPARHLAVRFSGKEAIIKALNNFPITLHYQDIEILCSVEGAPRVLLNPEKAQNFTAEISLSHCQDKALAFAIIQNE